MDKDTGRNTGGPGKSFDQRLRAARSRQGLDPEPPPPDAATPDATGMAVVFRVGAELVSALLVGLAIGWTLDHVLRTRPLFLILFLLLGGVAGMVNVWRLVAPPPQATGPAGPAGRR